MLDAGDEVVVFEPMYDSYQAGIALAGAALIFGVLGLVIGKKSG